jgi:hypothetical protein
LYGGPYAPVSLEPSSSAVAVATKSTGSVRDQDLIVLGGSSGEENRIASPTASANTTPSAIVASRRMS